MSTIVHVWMRVWIAAILMVPGSANAALIGDVEPTQIFPFVLFLITTINRLRREATGEKPRSPGRTGTAAVKDADGNPDSPPVSEIDDEVWGNS